MTLPRLNETDLAEFLTYDDGPALDARLRRYLAGSKGLKGSYRPARAHVCDALTMGTPLPLAVEIAPWHRIRDQIIKACTGLAKPKSNVEVIKALRDAAVSRGWQAKYHPMQSLSVGSREAVSYWSNLIIFDENGPFIPFFDFREAGPLSDATSRRIAYSMQNIGLRDRDIELADCRLAIIQFPVIAKKREIKVHFHTEDELLPYAELNRRVAYVYRAWERVWLEKPGKEKKAAGGGGR